MCRECSWKAACAVFARYLNVFPFNVFFSYFPLFHPHLVSRANYRQSYRQSPRKCVCFARKVIIKYDDTFLIYIKHKTMNSSQIRKRLEQLKNQLVHIYHRVSAVRKRWVRMESCIKWDQKLVRAEVTGAAWIRLPACRSQNTTFRGRFAPP